MSSQRRVEPNDLKSIDPLDGSLALMFFGWRGMIREADVYLDSIGLSRVHHRILFTVARIDDVTVGQLHETLGVSKQALHRPLRQLLDEDLMEKERHPGSHRHKILRLTAHGRKIERAASNRERRVMKMAFAQVGEAGRQSWSEVMAFIAQHA